MKRAGVRHIVVVAAVVLSGLLAGETGAAFRNPDGVAVIIGNRAYKYDVPQVTYAHRDAEAFRRYVVDVLGFDPENVIHKKDADKATMERVFGNRDSLTGSELWRRLHQDGLSDVVVFYSGHGIPGMNDKRGYLLPVNAHPDTAELNGYPIDVLYDNLVKLKEQKAVRSVHVFLDACFSGDSGGGRLIGSTSAIRVAPRIESAGLGKLTILTAASGKEVASWDKAAKHGLFTQHLLNALYGEGDTDADGQVTAAEAKAYLDRHMTRAARREFGRVQNADLRGVVTAVLARAVSGMFPVRPLIGQETQTGHRFRDCPTCPEMVVIPAGSYEMGSPASEEERDEEEGPLHRVTLAQPLAVGVYEITRGEFGRFVEATGYSTGNSCWTYESGKWKKYSGRHWRDPGFAQTDQHPVVCVSWKDVQAYLRWLSQETGQEYRLLSEAEWEYVARAGTRTARYWGESELEQCRYANGADASTDFLGGVGCADGYAWTSPVGSYVANGFGVHDVLGNVWEWVQDCWNDSYVGAPSDGSAWKSGDCSLRVVRGSSWISRPGYLRSASRIRSGTGYRNYLGGFRVARTPPDSEETLSAKDQQHEDEALQLALESIEKWEFKSSIEIENPDLQSSGCADTSVTDSSGRSLKDIADQWGYDPEEAYAFGLKIQDAVRERNLAAFFSLVDGELDYGPRRKYVENKDFHEIFPDSWRTAILNDEPPCTPVGWRGFMLGPGPWYRAPSEAGRAPPTLVLDGPSLWYKAPSKEYEEYPDRENYPDDKTHLEDLELWEQGKPLKHRPAAKQGTKPAAGPAKQPGGSDTFRIVKVHDWVPEKFPPVPVGWKVDDRLLPPTCFEYESDSGDPIYPFDDNTAVSRWRNVGDCAQDLDPDQLQISDSTVEYVYPTRGHESLRYRILADISPNLCQDLAPNLPGKCLESYLVDVDYCGGSMGCRGPYAIYGMFQMQDGERIIFPLKNFDTENLARNFLDSK